MENLEVEKKPKIISLEFFNFAGNPEDYEKVINAFFTEHKFQFDSKAQPIPGTGDIVVTKFLQNVTAVVVKQRQEAIFIEHKKAFNLGIQVEPVCACHIVFYKPEQKSVEPETPKLIPYDEFPRRPQSHA